jgi:hypothetical protein
MICRERQLRAVLQQENPDIGHPFPAVDMNIMLVTADLVDLSVSEVDPLGCPDLHDVE